jgi:hypothetical protein
VQQQIDQDLKQALLRNIRNPFAVPYRAGKMEYILSGYLPEEFLCKSR